MKITVIRNHNGVGTCGSKYDEGALLHTVLHDAGHQVRLLDPGTGFNGHPFPADEKVVITTQPEKNNDPLQQFVKRHSRLQICWRPGRAQLELVNDILKSGLVCVTHLCIEKAYTLTKMMSLTDSALVINKGSPGTVVVVSDPSGAAAAQFGRVVKVYSTRFDEREFAEGNGPAFFGAFLGEWFKTGDLPLSLAAGHRYGAAMASGNWATRRSFVQMVPTPRQAVAA